MIEHSAQAADDANAHTHVEPQLEVKTELQRCRWEKAKKRKEMSLQSSKVSCES